MTAKVLIVALQGSRRVKFTMKKEAALDAKYLVEIINRNGLIILNKSKMPLVTAASTGKWADDNDRTMVAILTNKFDEMWFLNRFRNSIEKIEIVNKWSLATN